MKCDYCDSGMRVSNLFMGKINGVDAAVSYRARCWKCKYEYEYEYGIRNVLKESNKKLDNDKLI